MFKVRYLASVLSFLNIHKDTVKKWGELWSGCKAGSVSHLPAQSREGLLRFCCTETSFPPRTSWKQGALFLHQATIWLQRWRFWHLKWVQPTTTLHTAQTESRACALGDFTQGTHPLCCFQSWTEKHVSCFVDVRKIEEGKGSLTWILALLWPCLQQTDDQFVWIWTAAATTMCFRERETGNRMAGERPGNATWQEWAQSVSCLFTPQREILSVALAPKQGLAENFELPTWSRNIKSLLTSTNTGKVTRYSSCKHKNAYLAHRMREFSKVLNFPLIRTGLKHIKSSNRPLFTRQGNIFYILFCF